MENLKINIKKSPGAIEACLTAKKMSTRPRKVIDRIRLKTAAVKLILEDKGYKPGVCIHADNAGCLDNSESCAQYNLETTWIFEDLSAPTPKKNKTGAKEAAPKTNTPKSKARNSKAKSQ